MFDWFRRKKERSLRDRTEAKYLRQRHGDDALAILRARADDDGLDERSRRHWQRIARIVERSPDG